MKGHMLFYFCIQLFSSIRKKTHFDEVDDLDDFFSSAPWFKERTRRNKKYVTGGFISIQQNRQDNTSTRKATGKYSQMIIIKQSYLLALNRTDNPYLK